MDLINHVVVCSTEAAAAAAGLGKAEAAPSTLPSSAHSSRPVSAARSRTSSAGASMGRLAVSRALEGGTTVSNAAPQPILSNVPYLSQGGGCR